MKLCIFAIGKLKAKPINDLVQDYSSRLKHYFPFERVVLKDDDSFLKKIGGMDHLIVCDDGGQQKTSFEFANMLAMYQNRRIKRLIFFIGGPEGVSPEVKKRANSALALSRMTFPHELAQAILLEQLYRAATILKGESYHK